MKIPLTAERPTEPNNMPDPIVIACDQSELPAQVGWYFLSVFDDDGKRREIAAYVGEHVSGLCVTLNGGRTWQPLTLPMFQDMPEFRFSRRLEIEVPNE